MAKKYDKSIASEIINQFGAKPEMLVQVLHAFVQRYGFISEEATRQIASELNLSRADVHGVVSFYHDFRTEPAGEHVLQICRAEACQAMGGRALEAHAKTSLNINYGETTADGRISLQPVYCLGNCACSPSVRIGDTVYARVDATRLDVLLAGLTDKDSA